GDGVLVEFASAVNAVQCAVDLQQGMAAANADQPGDKRIVLRIGVNLGDVMVEGSDLYGDGVNVAARLEVVADHGGVCVSPRFVATRSTMARSSSTLVFASTIFCCKAQAGRQPRHRSTSRRSRRRWPSPTAWWLSIPRPNAISFTTCPSS